MSYRDDLADARWQRKRLEIMKRDGWRCRLCNSGGADGGVILNVHHRKYVRGRKPWEYPDEDLVTLCRGCHEDFSERSREASRPLPIWACFVESRHGYYHFIDGHWLCSCGCGHTLPRDAFNLLEVPDVAR